MLHLIRNVVASVSRTMGFSPEDTSLIEISVDEACTNVIRHAYGDLTRNAAATAGEEPILRVTLQPAPEGLAISIHYSGSPPPNNHGRGVSSIEEYLSRSDRHGLGSYIINHFMDEVAYKTPQGRGTILSMVKYLQPPRNVQ